MVTVLLLTMAVGAPPVANPQSANQPTAQQPTAASKNDKSLSVRTRAQWREEVRTALRAQAKAKDLEQPAAVLKLLALYVDLGRDKQLSASEHKDLRTTLRNRLVRIRDELPLELKLRSARVELVTRRAGEQKKPQLLNKIKDDRAVLAQWQGALAQFGGGQGAAAVNAGGVANNADDGQQLVDLIQAVISPDTWSSNGGSSVIAYWQPSHALIVTAPTETQENVANLLEALRRAGN